MPDFPEQLTPERLMEAAEAAMQAAQENAEFTGGKYPYPADLMGTPVQPECLAPYTKWEIEQASEFLVRMGMIPAPVRKKHTA